MLRASTWILTALLWLIALCPLLAAQENPAPSRVVSIPMSDGIKIAAALYLPAAPGRYPTLLAASPYRFDNDQVPAIALFPWRETGPIGWYLAHGYAYLHMDVRGSGRSGGEYRYLDPREQRDLYEVVEWIARQPWSNGKVGGMGQSYYAMSQWFLGIANPPHLKCIAPYDGNTDSYRAYVYNGGIPSSFPAAWYDGVRMDNLYPLAGAPRAMPWDFAQAVASHPLNDQFWQQRAANDLEKIQVPLFSIGVWGKMDLHLNGNLVGFQRASGPKKLLVLDQRNVAEAVAEFASVPFHQQYLLPFYDWCLKGEQTSYVSAPSVRYLMVGSGKLESASSWPPPKATPQSFYLGAGPTGSVTSLNDGALASHPPVARQAQVVLHYPNPGWSIGVVGPGPDGRPDPARRVLTFTSAPLTSDLRVVGPSELVLYLSSSRSDADVFVKLSNQMAQPRALRQRGINPPYRIVSKGWLRASLRAIDEVHSRPDAPWYKFTRAQPLVPGRLYRLEIAVMPTAYVFPKGSRIRLELVNGDSPITDPTFTHYYTPNKIGADTIYYDASHPSHLVLSVLPQQGMH
jgi:predicted acyl esterase